MTNMNTKDKLRELRKIMGRTQAEFAMTIGASKDAVASWETNRNGLSPEFAKRIEFATGVDAGSLLSSKGKLQGRGFAGHLTPYTRGIYDKHIKTRAGRSDEVNARGHAKNCAEALEILFLAAAQPVRGERHRLPGVVQSFIEWCERSREDFKLDKGIEEELRQRKKKVEITLTYREWRRKQKEEPSICRWFGFKDDARKADGDGLTLSTTVFPTWRPGWSMSGSKGEAR
jgi:transcriptional regulator with XRE-family HTH domain